MSDKKINDKLTIELHFVVDRLEDEGWAVLAIGDDESITIDFPLSHLPADTAPGDHLNLRITRDDAARDKAADRTQQLLEELQARSDTAGKKDFKL